MSEWKAKRFWKAASIAPTADGFAVELDGRPVRTPAKRHLVMPSEAFARAVAAEWDAQGDVIDPLSMPFTRSANAAIDKVSQTHAEVADMLAAYGDSDLLSYRAAHPDALVARQVAAWDPMLDWAEDQLGVRLAVHTGVMHVAQDPVVLSSLAARVHKMSAFELAGFHDLVSLSGSLILGFGAVHDVKTPQELWALSRLDEIWQAEEWGQDEEAEAAAAIKESAFVHAKQVFDMSNAEKMNAG